MTAYTHFDEDAHAYWINGRQVPSVTQVLNDLLPCWQASEWHLQRGRAVHACAALIGRGIAFEADPQIAGQVEALRRFYREVKPYVLDIEQQVFSVAHQYAGTLDLRAVIGGKTCIVDFKASLTPTVYLQCAAYAAAHPVGCCYGVGVEIREDGTYAMSKVEPLRGYGLEWLALLCAFNVRRRLGVKEANREDAE